MNIPQPLWAVTLAALGVGLELAILFIPGASEATRHDVSIAAFGLISGAIGAFTGHASATAPEPVSPQADKEDVAK